jgi:fructokinase
MFLVCGEAVIDLFEDKAAGELRFHGQPAGSPFNVAVGLARLDCAVSFMTGLSTDPFGERLIAALEDEGIAWDLSPRTNRPTILSFVLVKPDGTPEYAFYGECGADCAVHAEALPDSLPESIEAIHLGGFPLAVEPSRSAYAHLIRREAEALFIALDPNIRASLTGDMDIFRDHFEELCAHVALIKASTEDIGLLYPGVDAMTIARRWRSLGTGTIVITDGPRGAFALNDGGTSLSKAAPVTVVDTVGAGDSFMAALLAGLQERGLLKRGALAAAPARTLKAILDAANHAAGITCTRQGANPPTRAELARP